MDKQLIDVCAMFGQHVKLTVTLPTLSEESATVSEVNPLRNAFSILMASQRALDKAKLPPKVKETRTSCSMILSLFSRASNGYGALVVYHMVNNL